MAYITFLDGLGSLPKLSLFSLESDQHVKTQDHAMHVVQTYLSGLGVGKSSTCQYPYNLSSINLVDGSDIFV